MNADYLAVAFAAGMAAAVNPCGFALLPAYLAYFLGLTDDVPADRRTESVSAALRRAVSVSIALTAGFLLVFGVIGSIWSSISSVVGSRLPWVTAVIGVGLMILGVAMLFGFDPVVKMPKVQFGSANRQLGSVFLFGVSYGIASLGCTIPIFLAVVSGTFSDSFVQGLTTFIAYALGMGALVSLLTIAVALAREGLVTSLRRLLPYMGRISGGLLVVAGLVVVYAGFAEIQQLVGRRTGTGAFEGLQDFQSRVVTWITDVGAGRLAIISGLLIGGAMLVAWLLRRRRPGSGPEALRSSSEPPATVAD